MTLTYKDALTTIAMVAVSYITAVMLNDNAISYINTWRKASIAVFTIGIGVCILIGFRTIPSTNAWSTLATALGLAALFLVLNGVVLNSKVSFLLLVSDVVALWAISTIHHIIQK